MKDFRVDHLKKSYGAKTKLEDFTSSINEGEDVGVIGQNGTGKISVLSILSGVDFAESGDITTSNDYRIGYLSQQPELDDEDTIFEALYKGDHPTLKVVHDFEEVVEQLRKNPTSQSLTKRYSDLEQKMNEIDGWQVEVQIKTILQKMGLTDIQKKVGTLSGGQKKRVGLAKVLMEEPDLLLLDEPTNHLDLEAIEWLEGYLANYKGAMMLVTHDRYFLERAVTHMFELVNGRIEAYEGNYESYLEQRSQREQIASRMSQKQKRLYQSELEWMRQGAKARTTKQQARIQRFEALEKDVKQTTSQEKLVMEFDQTRIGKRVFQMEDASLSINCQPIVKNLDWIIQSKARIGIAGVNGVGKSTFLNAIAGQIPFDSGQFVVGETVRIAYYKQQDEDIPMDKQLIQYLREEAEEIKRANGEVASISELLETFLFPRHLHGAYIHTLSGGERRRLYLLRLLMTKPNVLLLDEPTNDLDIDTLTVLEDFLQSFNGAVLIVSHDRYFLDKTVEQLFVIRGEGQTELFYGSMSDYLEQEKSLSKVVIEAPKVEKSKEETTKLTPAKKMTYQEKKEWETIETTIQELEEKLESLQREMTANAQDFAKLQALQEELDKTEEAAANAYDRWEYLAELAGN